MTGVVLALAALLAPAPSPAVPLKLPPVEQCNGDREFDDFRYKLRQAVARRDREALLELFAPNVLINFGGGRGRGDLVKEWEFDAAEPDNIWDQVETMLKLGCVRDDEVRIIPSLIMQADAFPEDEVERILLLPGATLYRSAGVEARNSDTISWTVARVTSRAVDWGTGVRLPDGREGYIPDRDVYEPTDFRLLIEQREGKWLITAFIAGD